MSPKVTFDREKLAEFCRRNHIRELSFFGSVLRDDFKPESDIDVMVEFQSDAKVGLFEFVGIAEELELLLGRRVDLVTRRSIEDSDNYIRRRHILSRLEPIYVAG
jgi:predicted nucleotidyltransferase